MKRQGPRNISIFALTHYRFPLPAITSILHRISGIIVFLMIPFLLWMLHLSLISQVSFITVKDYLASPTIEFLVWITLSALFFHFVTGIKHLLMDIGFFEEKFSGKAGSLIALVIGFAGIIGIGIWLI